MLPTPRPISRRCPCDLCGDEQFQLVADRDRRGRPLATVVCLRCGLLAHAEVPGEGALQEYYERQYRAEYQGEYLPAPHRVIREWNRGRDLVRLLRPHLERHDHIMEIGCGIGCTVKQLELAGYESSGLEPGEGFRRFASDQLGAAWNGVCWPIGGVRRTTMWCSWCTFWSTFLRPRQPCDRCDHYCASAVGCTWRCRMPEHRMRCPSGCFTSRTFTTSLPARWGCWRRRVVFAWRVGYPPPRTKTCVRCSPVGKRRAGRYRRRATPARCGMLRDYDRARYYLRGSYLRERLRTLIGHWGDRLACRTRLRRILRQCRGDQEGFPSARRCCSRSSAIM